MWFCDGQRRVEVAPHRGHVLLAHLHQPRWSVAARLKSGKTKPLVTPWLRQAQAEEIAALIETELRG